MIKLFNESNLKNPNCLQWDFFYYRIYIKI